MPGVHEPEQEALEVNVVACVEHVAGDEAARHEQGYGADRQQEEHRNENQLGGHGGTGADLELDPQREHVGGGQSEHDERRRTPCGVEQEERRQRGGEECGGDQGRRRAVAVGQAAGDALARSQDQAVRLRIEVGVGYGSPGRKRGLDARHALRIGHAGAHACAFTRRRDEESALSSPKRVMRGHPDMHTVSPSSRREGVL
jgi:hypothetical protein